MELTKCCLMMTVALTLLAHCVLSMPKDMHDESQEEIDIPPAMDMAMMEDGEPTILMERFRRSLAQMAMGSNHFNDYDVANSRRWNNRRRHFRRNFGNVVIADA